MQEQWIIDIEVYTNFYSCTGLNYKTNEVKVFCCFNDNWIHGSYDEHTEWFKGKIIVGYNSMDYDNTVINFINSAYVRNEDIYNFSKQLIESDAPVPRKYRFTNEYQTIDLMRMAFSKMLRVSLKAISVSLNHELLQELPIQPWEWIREDDVEPLLKYNLNDVIITKKFLEQKKANVNLRYKLSKQFGWKVMNFDDVKLGLEIIDQMYYEKTGIHPKELAADIDQYYDVKPVIFDHIVFESELLRDVQNKFRVACQTGVLNEEFVFGDCVISVGKGGIHSLPKPSRTITPKGYKYVSSDVSDAAS